MSVDDVAAVFESGTYSIVFDLRRVRVRGAVSVKVGRVPYSADSLEVKGEDLNMGKSS